MFKVTIRLLLKVTKGMTEHQKKTKKKQHKELFFTRRPKPSAGATQKQVLQAVPSSTSLLFMTLLLEKPWLHQDI